MTRRAGSPSAFGKKAWQPFTYSLIFQTRLSSFLFRRQFRISPPLFWVSSMVGSAQHGSRRLLLALIGTFVLQCLLLAQKQTVKPFEEQFPALKRIDRFEQYTNEQQIECPKRKLCFANLFED
jgi:hypothetical protein